MSGTASGRFAIIPARAIDDRKLGNAAFKVLAALGTYGNREGHCWPSLATLAKRLGVTKQAVEKQIGPLAELGYIEIQRRTRPNGSSASNAYKLLFDGDLAAVHDQLHGAENAAQGVNVGLTGGQPDVDGTSTPEVDGGSTPEVDPLTSYRTNHKNDNVRFLAENQFENFWRAYPSRKPHGNPKKPARQKFEDALKQGTSAADIIRGAKNFATYTVRQKTEPRFVPQAVTWLNKEQWEDFQDAPADQPEEAGWI